MSMDGVGAKMYTRAAMHPLYANEEVLDATIRMILRDRLPSTQGLDLTDRCTVAVQAARGWMDHRDAARPADRQPVIWHRLIGSTRISVGVAS